jgi:hypothetical protein
MEQCVKYDTVIFHRICADSATVDRSEKTPLLSSSNVENHPVIPIENIGMPPLVLAS